MNIKWKYYGLTCTSSTLKIYWRVEKTHDTVEPIIWQISKVFILVPGSFLYLPVTRESFGIFVIFTIALASKKFDKFTKKEKNYRQ